MEVIKMKNMFKKAKDWIRNGLYIGKYGNYQEKKLNQDEEHKPFVRGKRQNLPDGYTDTKWIKRPKSWKDISKNDKQYKNYNKSITENKELYEEEQFLYLLKTKYKNNWYYFYYNCDDKGKVDFNQLWKGIWNDQWYSVADRLIKKKKLDAQYYIRKWGIESHDKSKTKNIKYITAVKLKQ